MGERRVERGGAMSLAEDEPIACCGARFVRIEMKHARAMSLGQRSGYESRDSICAWALSRSSAALWGRVGCESEPRSM